MQINQKLAELAQECKRRGICLATNVKYTKREYASKIREDVLKHETRSEALLWYVNKIETPMLCSNFKDYPLGVQEVLLEENRWVVQPSYDGIRVLFCLDNTGFHFYSRVVGEDCFPMEYDIPRIVSVDSFPKYNLKSFIFDCELVCSKRKLRDYFERIGVSVESDKAAITMLFFLSQNRSPEEARRWIKECLAQADDSLRLVVLDVLKVDDVWLIDNPLDERLDYIRTLPSSTNGWFLVDNVASDTRRGGKAKKVNYLRQWMAKGGDGVILKDITSTYNTLERRTLASVKIKKKFLTGVCFEDMLKPVAAFILGARDGMVAFVAEGREREGVIAYINMPEAINTDGVIKEEFCMKRYLIDGDYIGGDGRMVNPMVVEAL